MSETSSGTCACGKTAASCPATPKTDASAKPSGIQNGKGDAPRNISEDFRRNYGGIKWKSGGKLKKGEKFVKAYG